MLLSKKFFFGVICQRQILNQFNISKTPIITNSKPAMLFEYLPSNVLPILFPIETPIEIEIMENIPIDNDAYSGETPVIPAPKPMVKQLMPSTIPRKIDSFHPIFFSTTSFGKKLDLGALFLEKSVEEVMIIHRPRKTIKNPPMKFAVECEK